MFYSHEFLSSREHGVATIWVVATLGAKSACKKVQRKQIAEVNVPKACKTFIMPKVPLALRLQSCLLYGVAKVHSEQCGYVLVDAQHLTTLLRDAQRAPEATQLARGHKLASREQLTLEDDPSFLPELSLSLPEIDIEAALAAGSHAGNYSSSLSPFPSLADEESDKMMGGLVIPSDTPSAMSSREHFNLPSGGTQTSHRVRDMGSGAVQQSYGDIDLDADFGFDELGNFYTTPAPQRTAAGGTAGGQVQLGSETGISERVRRDHEQGGERAAEFRGDMDMDFQLPDDGPLLPDGEAFPLPDEPGVLPESERNMEYQQQIVRTSSTDVAAPRRPRIRKPIGMDETTELRNIELARWNTDYLQNMQKMLQSKLRKRNLLQAKKNAEWFVWGRGIADIGCGIGYHKLRGPLAVFCGDTFYEMITGRTRDGKRPADSPPEGSDPDQRRVRQRSQEDEELARRREDDGFVLPSGGGLDDIEIARSGEDAAARELDDHGSSALPWNTTPTIRGSSVTLGSAQPPLFPQSLTRRPHHHHHHHRTASASPLLSRGAALDPHSSLGPSGVGDMSDGLLAAHEEFERYGPAAFVDTQTAADTQWVREALDNEGHRFLAFIEHGIQTSRAASADLDGVVGEQVLFEELLPPEKNSRIVAAQGFLHVLALATKGLLVVRQARLHGEIVIRLV